MNQSIFNREPSETRDGVPMFAPDRYWGKAPSETMQAALETIDGAGWGEFAARYEGKFDFAFDESRADWRFNLPITRDSVVLDCGAGMGRNSIPLARVAGRVVAFDQSFLRMAFLRRRAGQEGLANIDVCVADIYSLPFADGTFDVIAMNGVLEWVAANSSISDPRQAQIECLRICRRLLKPGGYLYVGIENRTALAYLKAPDHGGLRYTGYMPRRVADIYARMRGRTNGYRTYTYSRNGYARLLREAGFPRQSFYLPYPGYNLPRIVIPYDNLEALKYVAASLLPGNSARRKAFKSLIGIPGVLRLYRSVFWSFNIIAQP